MTHSESTTDLIIFSSEAYGNIKKTKELLSEFAVNRRVYFVASPIVGVSTTATYFLKKLENEVTIIQPYLPEGMNIFDQSKAQLEIIREFIVDENITHYTVWTDTPKSMPILRYLSAEVIIYDSHHESSENYGELEQELLEYADVVLNPDNTGERHVY